MTDHLAKTLAFYFAFACSEFFTIALLYLLPKITNQTAKPETLLLMGLFFTIFNLIFSYKASRVVGWG